MRTSGKLTPGLVITSVVIVATAAIFVLTFDWNRVRPYLNDRVSQAIGRPSVISGDLVLTWKKSESESGWRTYVPWPRLIANDITVGNPDWAEQPNVAAIQQLMFVLGALPLLTHRTVIPSATLNTPAIALEHDKQNRNGWMFDLTHGEDNNRKPPDWKLDPHEIVFSRGSLALDDDIKRIHLAVAANTIDNQMLYTAVNSTAIRSADQLAKEPVASGAAVSAIVIQMSATSNPRQPYGTAWTVKGIYNDAAIAGNGRADSMLRLQNM